MARTIPLLIALLASFLIAHPSRAQDEPTPKPSSQGNTFDSLSSTGSLFGQKLDDGSFGKAPTTIKSDSLSINAKDRIFVYRGNVKVVQGDMTLLAKTIEGLYSEGNQIQKLTAKGNVIITKQDIKATAQQALYDAPAAIVTLTDNPQLQQQQSILTADRIKIFLNENRSQAEGDVRVTVVKSEGGPGTPAPTPKAHKPGVAAGDEHSPPPAAAAVASQSPTPGPLPSPETAVTAAPTPKAAPTKAPAKKKEAKKAVKKAKKAVAKTQQKTQQQQ